MHLSVNSSKENMDELLKSNEVNSMDDGQYEVQK